MRKVAQNERATDLDESLDGEPILLRLHKDRSAREAAAGSTGTLSCVRASPSCFLSPDGYCLAVSSAVPSTTGMCSYYYYYYFYLNIILASSVLSPEKRVIAA